MYTGTGVLSVTIPAISMSITGIMCTDPSTDGLPDRQSDSVMYGPHPTEGITTRYVTLTTGLTDITIEGPMQKWAGLISTTGTIGLKYIETTEGLPYVIAMENETPILPEVIEV